MQPIGLIRLIILISVIVLISCTDSGDEPTPTISGASEGTRATALATATVVPEASATSSPATPIPSPPTATPTARGEDSNTTPTTPTSQTERQGDLPDSPVGNRLAWVLEQVNYGAEDLTPEVIEEQFTPELQRQLPPDQASQMLRDFATTYAPLSFERFWEPPLSNQATAVVTSDSGEELLIGIAVETEPPYRITSLGFQPVPQAAQLTSWDEFDAQLAVLAPSVGFMAAEVGNGECDIIHALDADQRLAIGSTFKLYVLGELARQIQAGDASWDEELAIDDRWKSLPSGTMQDEPTGTTFPLRRYAEQMIAISDNTATDHLIHRLGRENIEAIQTEMGHGEPERNIPFLSTREVFALKLTMSDQFVERYLSSDPDEQRALLNREVNDAEVTFEDAVEWTDPRFTHDIEWFASSADLCQAMVWLHEAAQQPDLEPLQDILSANTGVPIDEDHWSWVGFKGGSEPGVLNLTWLLEHAGGDLFVVTATLNDTEEPLQDLAVIELLMGAIDFLGKETS